MIFNPAPNRPAKHEFNYLSRGRQTGHSSHLQDHPIILAPYTRNPSEHASLYQSLEYRKSITQRINHPAVDRFDSRKHGKGCSKDPNFPWAMKTQPIKWQADDTNIIHVTKSCASVFNGTNHVRRIFEQRRESGAKSACLQYEQPSQQSWEITKQIILTFYL